MERPARTRLTAVVVIAIVAVPLVTLALGGSGGESKSTAPGLRIERSGSAPELIVSVDPKANVAERAAGARTVMLRCVDKADRLVSQQEEAWPFGGSDGIAVGPHAHVPLDPAGMGSVDSCRLEGTEPLLEGPVR